MLHTVREWGYVPLDTGAANDSDAVSRGQADRWLRTARQAGLRLGVGEGGVLADGRFRLRAQQVVGVIPDRGATLEILPKIGDAGDETTRINLVRMLARVLQLPILDGELTALGEQHYDLLEILIHLFCRRLFEALHRGMPRKYIPREDETSALRGRLDVHRQFTRLAVTPQRLACRFEELDSDIAINQVLKGAVTYLRGIAREPGNQRKLAELDLVYADVSPIPLTHLPWETAEHQLDRTNRAWHDLMRLAAALLGRRYQTTSAGQNSGFALLFEMNTLFEEFIGLELRRELQPLGFTVSLQSPTDFALHDEVAGSGRFVTRPDIVVQKNGSPLLIIDTKWKELTSFSDDPKGGISQADVYQMMAYAHVYQADELMLLYPYHRRLAAADGLHRAFRIGDAGGKRLTIASIDLAHPHKVREKLASLVTALV